MKAELWIRFCNQLRLNFFEFRQSHGDFGLANTAFRFCERNIVFKMPRF